jgi:hypothetical protein
MIATFVMVAALTAGGYDPVEPRVHQAPGPAFQIPCKVDGIQAIERVQLYVSDNRGKTWTLYEEITPDKSAFTFMARKPGEYWFTARLKKKDGTLDPADQSQFVVMQRVAVETGVGSGDPLVSPAKPTMADTVKELDEELTRIEMELIRKEIKRLTEAKKLTSETEEKIDRLRGRLRRVQDRIRSDREDATNELRSNPPGVYPAPGTYSPAPPDDRIPPPPPLPPVGIRGQGADSVQGPLGEPVMVPRSPEAPMPRVVPLRPYYYGGAYDRRR